MDTENTISVLTYRLEEALTNLKKLARKAERYGTPTITWTLGTPRFEEFFVEGQKTKLEVTDIILNHIEAPKVGNYTFAARLEIVEGGTIIDGIPGVELPDHFRHSDGHCEHCNQDRLRKHLFVVQDDVGNFVQVGRSCLRDYMGTDTPASVAARFSFIRQLRDFGDEWNFGGRSDDSALELLAVTSVAIRLWGWIPKSAPEEAGTPTAFSISPWFYCNLANKHDVATRDQLKAAIRPEDWVMAQDTLDWVAGTDSGDSQYIHNLRLVLGLGAVEPVRRGLACSAVGSYQRHIGKLLAYAKQKEEAVDSNHIGAEKERLRGLKLRVTAARGVTSEWGESILYKFIDEGGNLFSWFSSNGAELDVNQEVEVDATVKSHNEFRGVKETQLTRTKVKA